MKRGQAAIALVFTVFMVVSAAAGPVAAAAGDDLNFGDDHEDGNTAPEPYIDIDTLTVSAHPMDEGTSDESMTGYFDDEGDWVNGSESLFEVNTTSDIDDGTNVNPYTFKPGWIEDPDFGAFPRRGDEEDDPDTDDSASEDNLASALDASEWTAVQNSGNVTISDTTVASGVEAVRFNVDKGGNNTDVVAEVSYSNWTSELDSDEEKRVLQLAVDIDELEADTQVQINITDESDDYKQVTIDQDDSWDSVSSLGNSTGDSRVNQVQLTDLTTNGGGSYDNIESINITVRHGSFDGSFTWIDLESKSIDDLGTEATTVDKNGVDNDGDGEWDETQIINQSSGTISVNDMASLDSEFDDATITDVQFRARALPRYLETRGEEEDYEFYFQEADDFPGWHSILNVSYKLELPALIDLSYSGTDLEMVQKWPEERYVEFGLLEDAGTTDLNEVSYNSQLSSLASKGDSLSTLDSSISTDTEYALHFELKLTSAEEDSLKQEAETTATPAAGGAGGPIFGGGGGIVGGIVDFFSSTAGIILTGIATVVQFVRRGFPFNRIMG